MNSKNSSNVSEDVIKKDKHLHYIILNTEFTNKQI